MKIRLRCDAGSNRPQTEFDRETLLVDRFHEASAHLVLHLEAGPPNSKALVFEQNISHRLALLFVRIRTTNSCFLRVPRRFHAAICASCCALACCAASRALILRRPAVVKT